jgi:hypothetical protein
MRYLVGATYVAVSVSLLPLLVEAGGGLALLLRGAVWLVGAAGPLLCAIDCAGLGDRGHVRRSCRPSYE